MSYRPLSQRENPTLAFDGPHEGLPRWMMQAARKWARQYFTAPGGEASVAELEALEVVLRVEPLEGAYPEVALESLMARMWRDQGFALDVLDYLLRFTEPDSPSATKLNSILTLGGSVWEVRPAASDRCQLARRAIGPVPEVIESARTTSERAHAHLTAAWGKLMGRNPDPSGAYREAVRAVESAAVPVVTPNDRTATLGKVIGEIRATPERWSVDLAEATPEQVADMAAMIWRSQLDRHGTDDESVPLTVSQEQADAAVHIAIALVRLFAGGHISAV